MDAAPVLAEDPVAAGKPGPGRGKKTADNVSRLSGDFGNSAAYLAARISGRMGSRLPPFAVGGGGDCSHRPFTRLSIQYIVRVLSNTEVQRMTERNSQSTTPTATGPAT
jgi:hypothetical protein